MSKIRSVLYQVSREIAATCGLQYSTLLFCPQWRHYINPYLHFPMISVYGHVAVVWGWGKPITPPSVHSTLDEVVTPLPMQKAKFYLLIAEKSHLLHERMRVWILSVITMRRIVKRMKPALTPPYVFFSMLQTYLFGSRKPLNRFFVYS